MSLTVVPTQQSPLGHPRENAFQRAVEDALASLSGPEVVQQVVRLYQADTRALVARTEGLAKEASDKAAESRQRFDMLTQVQLAASHKIWEGARMGAELATYRDMFEQLRHIAERTDGAPLEAVELQAALSVEPMRPVHQAVTLGFVPSTQFRGGMFVSEPDRDVTFIFTFIGWALVDHGPGALGCIEPMFLVDDRALSRSVIEHERHTKLEKFLPNIEFVAA